MRVSLKNVSNLTHWLETWFVAGWHIWKGIVWFPTIFVCWWNRLTLVLHPPHGLASTFLVSADSCGLVWTITFAAPLTTTSTHFNNNCFSSPGRKSAFFRDRERVFRRSCNAHSLGLVRWNKARYNQYFAQVLSQSDTGDFECDMVDVNIYIYIYIYIYSHGTFRPWTPQGLYQAP